ncbi:DUF1838 family protein [Sphingomonas sp. OK281]|uniref:DUF1838 family protein n=1 Tax=Sphingomonas sp. OK281 TaxID=1881067 RepID=UPI0008E0057E|nr:DUF1838 family protein [Sphingomonas sp. OK281]SFO03099.1 Protein of unknown function [Sphingomonas sp. OK281]
MIEMGRRRAIGMISGTIGAGLAGLGLTETSLASPAPRRGGALDFARSEDRLKAYMLMRGALDERLVIGGISGSYFGVVDDRITPLWDVTAVTFARYRRRADGGYDGYTAEVAYFIDPQTRRATGQFRNPYTDEIVIEPQQGYPPAHVVIGADLSFGLAVPIPGLVLDHRIKQPDVRGDDVWISEISQSAMTLPGAAANVRKPVRYSENIIMHARRSELETPGVRRVRTDVSFTNIVSWRPWMNMGDRPGHLTAIGAGSVSDTMDLLPADWIAATREKRPALLDNPGMLLDAIWNTAGKTGA